MKLLLRNLLFVVLMPGTVVAWAPLAIVYMNHWGGPSLDVPGAAALACILCGALICGWCVRDFAVKGRGTPAPIDPPKNLVVSGLYRYTRNPMYLGALMILLGEAALWRSGVLLIYSGCFFLVVNLFVLAYEEPHLRRQFGASYQDYRAHVPRWFPYKKGYTAPDNLVPKID